MSADPRRLASQAPDLRAGWAPALFSGRFRRLAPRGGIELAAPAPAVAPVRRGRVVRPRVRWQDAW